MQDLAENAPDLSADDLGGILSVSILSDGSPIADTVRVAAITVHKVVNRIPYAELSLEDGDLGTHDFPVSNSEAFKPGAQLTIQVGRGPAPETIFTGIVVKHGVRLSGENASRLVVECRDQAMAMTIGRRNTNFIDSTDSDIMTKLISAYGALTARVDATSITWKELVQYYCTDWDFVVSRAEANGRLVIVEDGTVAVVTPKTSASAVLSVRYGRDLIDFDAEIDARTQFSSVQGFSWSSKDQAVVSGTASRPESMNSQGNLDAATLAQVAGLATFVLQTAAPLDKAAVDAWSKAQQVRAGLARIRGRMTFEGSSKVRPGTLVALDGVGDRFNGDVFVSGVHHRVSAGGWVTEVEFGMPAELLAERHDLAAPPAAGLLPGVDGLQIGVVKKLDADPAGENRIQVSVPLMQADTDGVWARLASFFGTSRAGAFFMPEIGDEVVLGYLNNDPSHPVILGSLYSSSRQPPYTLTAKNEMKGLKTKAGLLIELNDETGVITIQTPGGNKCVISDDAKGLRLQDQSGNSVELNDSGITLDSKKDIKISAVGAITLSATGAINVSAKADLKLDGLNVTSTAQVGFTAKGTATAELSASGQTTVKGGIVMIN